MEQERAAADKFLTSVLVPFYKKFRYYCIIGDFIDPLIEEYNQREGTSFGVADLWFAVQDRMINLDLGRGHGLGPLDDLGLAHYNYDSIRSHVEELKNEHARAEQGVEYWGLTSDAGLTEELASRAREIKRKIKSMKDRGREELGIRRERGNSWLQEKGFSTSKELLQKLLDGTIGQKK